jgi:hypothetical protein
MEIMRKDGIVHQGLVKKIIGLLILVTFASACAPHQAMIHSEPSGATVMIDGAAIGATPIAYDYRLSNGDTHRVSVAYDGYEPVALTIAADKTDQGAMKRWMMAGLVWSPLWLGSFFTKKLSESYMFVMKRSTPQLTAKLERRQN